ncbi:MAG: MvaI/BcnI family restriction endonuclease [Coriobacteriales bacterium]|jgi:hypothetical protein|nr:MvaI/BcnI family restriction endonuclease [Coriobacteriales bacterium]
MSDTSVQVFTKPELIQKFHEIESLGWVECRHQGSNADIGSTLESLLGIEENNLPIPNASEWELKTQRVGTVSLVTLFHCEPSPTALKFVVNMLLPQYGWQHKSAGVRYPETEMSFRQTISAKKRSDRGFTVVVNRKEKKVQISFDAKSVEKRHAEWLNSVEERVGLADLQPQPYWGFRDLEHKVGIKLKDMFFVLAETKRLNGKDYCHYYNVLMLRDFSFKAFLRAIEDGNVLIDFDSRTGHNHGTKFRLRQNCFTNLYSTVETVLHNPRLLQD